MVEDDLLNPASTARSLTRFESPRRFQRLRSLGKVGVMPGGSTRRYPQKLMQRAVRMVAEIAGKHESEWSAMSRVPELPGLDSGLSRRAQ